MFTLNDIEASLKYGKINAQQQIILKICFITIIILSAVSALIGILSLIFLSMTSKEIACIILTIFMLITFLILIYYLLKKSKKRDYEINEWLKDAVKCKAQIMRLDFTSTNYQSYQIEVSFEFKNKKIKQISKKFNLITEGYPKIFAKYHNKIVPILYSEKYDEILILKK